MAGQIGRPSFDLKKDLFDHPKSYSFFQAIRLLRLLLTKAGAGSEEILFHDQLRVRPLLSLSFPGTDVQSVEELPLPHGTRYRLTATFLGLYGASSPLPTHYTEDLLDEASDDRTVTRDFLDILSFPFYRLFFKVWSRNRWFIKVAEEGDPAYRDRLFCLMGLALEEFRRLMPRPDRYLRYIGLFTQFPRSATGLRTLLSDALGVAALDIEQCVPRLVAIPENQRCLLGQQATRLGDDCHLGQEVTDRAGRIRILAGPLDEESFHALLPAHQSHEDLRELTRAYLFDPLESELELSLKTEEAHAATLGEEKWAALGHDTWLFSGSALTTPAVVTFRL